MECVTTLACRMMPIVAGIDWWHDLFNLMPWVPLNSLKCTCTTCLRRPSWFHLCST